MAYGYNPYPQNYFQQPTQYPAYQQTYTPQNYTPQQNNGVLWVQGEEGAKAYMVAAGNSVLLMDSENPVFYLKSCDQSGIPSLRMFDYTERTTARTAPQAASVPSEQFVTRKEFEEFVRRVAPKEVNINE